MADRTTDSSLALLERINCGRGVKQASQELCFYCVEANYCHIHSCDGTKYNPSLFSATNFYPIKYEYTTPTPTSHDEDDYKPVLDIRLHSRVPRLPSIRPQVAPMAPRNCGVSISKNVSINSLIKVVEDNEKLVKKEPVEDDISLPGCRSGGSDETIPYFMSPERDVDSENDDDVSECEDYESETIQRLIFNSAPATKAGRSTSRARGFVCDVCGASFTLKQNVQCHIFKYHMKGDAVPAPYEHRRYKCLVCDQTRHPLPAPTPLASLLLMNAASAASPLGDIFASTASSTSSASFSSSTHLLTPPLSGGGGATSSEMTIGDLLTGARGSEFLAQMRSALERAAEEKRKTEKAESVERKRKNLEAMVEGMMKKRMMQKEKENDREGEREKQSDKEETKKGGASSPLTTVGELFKSATSAARHDKKHHKKGDKASAAKAPFVCEECGKQFASQFQLKEHVSILHLRERKFACEVCGQKFGRRGGVRRHVQMVHLNQLHKCPYEGCDHPGYKCSKALAAHIRSVHTNVRPFACEECGKDFVRRNDLKMHQLTHNGEAIHKCRCGSAFRRTLYLKKHQKTCIQAHDDSPSGDEGAESASSE